MAAAVKLLAVEMEMAPSGVDDPMLESSWISPVPAAMLRACVPFIVPMIWMSPAPAPVERFVVLVREMAFVNVRF